MRKTFMLFTALVLIASFTSQAQITYNVTIDPAATNYCQGQSIDVHFDASSFDPGNTFSLQLSNDNFQSNIVTLSGSNNNTQGTNLIISTTLPTSQFGPNQRIRVIGNTFTGNSIFTASTAFNINGVSASAALSTICAGQSTTLSTNTTGTSPVYSWAPGGATTASINVNPSSTTTYTVTATANTCVSTATVTVNVTQLPNLTSTMPASDSICTGQTLQLSAAAPGASFVWSGPTGYSSNQANNSITNVQAANAGTYTIVATAAGCSTSLSRIIRVDTLPVVSAGQDVTLCAGSSAQLSAQPQSGSYSYLWSPATGLTNSAISNPVATQPGNTFTTYAVTVTDAHNCSATDNMLLTVIPIPNATNTGSQTVCAGDQVNILLTSSTTFLPGIFNYTWTPQPGIGFTAVGSPNDTISFTAINTSSLPVQSPIQVTPFITYNNVTCTGAITTVALITVNPAPKVNPVSDITACNGTLAGPITFTGTAPSYKWQASGDIISSSLAMNDTGNIDTFTVNIGNSLSQKTATIIVIADSLNLCGGGRDTFTVTVNPTPVINATLDTVFCHGTVAAIDTFSTINQPTNLVSYTWSAPNMALISAQPNLGSGNFTSINVANTTDSLKKVDVIVTPKIGSCIGVRDTFTITVNPKPRVSLLQTPASIYCNNSITGLINFSDSTFATFPITYTWSVVGNIGLPLSGTTPFIPAGTANIGADLSPKEATINIVPNRQGCASGDLYTFKIKVLPTPRLVPTADQAPCNNTLLTIPKFASNILNLGLVDTNIKVQATWDGILTSIGLSQTSGPDSIIAFTAVNNGTVAVTSMVIVTPTYDGIICPSGIADTFNIKVKPTPRLSSDSVKSVCSDAVFSYQAASSVTSPATTFTWNRLQSGVIDSSSGTNGNINHVLTSQNSLLPLNVTYQIHLTADGCTNTEDLIVNIKPVAAKLNLSADAGLCESNSVVTVSADRAEFAGEKFHWSVSNTSGNTTQIIDSVGRVAIISFGKGENVVSIYSVINNNGCPSPVETENHTFTAPAVQHPRVIRKGDNLICLANRPNVNGISYLWGRTSQSTLVDEFFNNEKGQEYHLLQPNDINNFYYWVMIRIAGEECSRKVYYNEPGKGPLPELEPEALNIFKVYPNPAMESVTIELADIEGRNTIEISDITGKLVSVTDVAENKTPISLAQMAPGCYFISWKKYGLIVETQKLIKN